MSHAVQDSLESLFTCSVINWVPSSLDTWGKGVNKTEKGSCLCGDCRVVGKKEQTKKRI